MRTLAEDAVRVKVSNFKINVLRLSSCWRSLDTVWLLRWPEKLFGGEASVNAVR